MELHSRTATPSSTHRPGHFEASFEGRYGTELFEQGWLPDEAPRAAVHLVHGLADHSSRYVHLASYLQQAGFAVYAFDLHGHGRSGGRRAYVGAFETFQHDLGAFLARGRHRHPELQHFLFGHSLGGAIAAHYCARGTHGPMPDGLLLSSPYLLPGSHIPPAPYLLVRLLGRLAPRLPTIRLAMEDLSQDPAVVKDAATDPLRYHGRIPARTNAEILYGVRYVWKHIDRIMLPLLVFHGTSDPIAAPEGSYRLYQHAASTDKTLGIYEDLLHETLNEPEREQVLDEIRTWLDEHTSPNPDFWY